MGSCFGLITSLKQQLLILSIEISLFHLFGEKMGCLQKRFENKFVMDIVGDRVLYADARLSLERPFLKVNDKVFGDAYSSALLDFKGRPIYFKQRRKKKNSDARGYRIIEL